MKTYQVTLPDEFAAFVDRMIAERKFDDLDHLFLYAIARVEDEMSCDEVVDQEWLRKEIQKGIDQLDRGEGVNGPTFMAQLREKLQDKQRTSRHAP